MIAVISQTTFQDQAQGGQAVQSQANDDDIMGWPIKWQPPYWFAQQNQQQHNPYLRILQAENDGFVKWYDPTTNTYWRQHPSGSQEGLLTSGVVHTYPTKHAYAIGGGGSQYLHGGQHDVALAHQGRFTIGLDSYHNHGGMTHTFASGEAKMIAGNSKHVITGNHHTDMAGSGSSWGVGVGSNSPQDAAISMTSKRIVLRTQSGAGAGGSGLGGSTGSQGQNLAGAGTGTQSGDIWIISGGGNAGSGRSGIQIQADKGSFTVQSGDVSITTKNGDVTIRGAKNISLVPGGGGNVQVQGNMQVQGTATIATLNAPTANITNLYVTNGNMGGSPTPQVNIASGYSLNNGNISS